MFSSQTKPVGDIPWEKLSAPAQRALTGAGLSTLAEVAAAGEKKIRALHGIGPHAIKVLRAALDAQGLTFAP